MIVQEWCIMHNWSCDKLVRIGIKDESFENGANTSQILNDHMLF